MMAASLKRFGPWVLAIALLVGAWFVQLNTPDEFSYEQPFVKTVSMGELGTGRNIAVTVTDVVIADEVTDADGMSLTGRWVVVNFDAEAVHSARQANLRYATLLADDLEYFATERLASAIEMPLVPGIPRSGSVAFEAAPEALKGTLAISFALDQITMLDSVIEVRVPVDEVRRVPEVTLLPVDWAAGEAAS